MNNNVPALLVPLYIGKATFLQSLIYTFTSWLDYYIHITNTKQIFEVGHLAKIPKLNICLKLQNQNMWQIYISVKYK